MTDNENGAMVLMRIRKAQMMVTTEGITVRTDSTVTTATIVRKVANVSFVLEAIAAV